MNLSTQYPAPAALSVTGLGKAFGGTVVLDGIDLDVPAGTVFAPLGPKGRASPLLNCDVPGNPRTTLARCVYQPVVPKLALRW